MLVVMFAEPNGVGERTSHNLCLFLQWQTAIEGAKNTRAQPEVVVAAAANLTDAFEEIGKAIHQCGATVRAVPAKG